MFNPTCSASYHLDCFGASHCPLLNYNCQTYHNAKGSIYPIMDMSLTDYANYFS